MKIVLLDDNNPLKEKAIECETKIHGSHFINPSNTTLNYLLINEDEIVGEIDYSLVVDEAEILYFYIIEEKRGNGYSKRLLEETINHLKAKGIKKIFLEVNENNIIAKNLYNNFGFYLINKRTNYYGNADALMMRKDLWIY